MTSSARPVSSVGIVANKRPRKIAISEWGHSGYYQAIKRAGGEPVIIKPDTPLSEFEKCKGLIIPGGRDVDPAWYGEKPHDQTQISDIGRDALEIALIRRAMKHDIPVLGVCRGHQLLNVATGGTLIQHVSGHVSHVHPVWISTKSRLMDFINDVTDGDVFRVNSLHHQVVGAIGKDMRAVAFSATGDGLVEAIESMKHTFVLGVQWHPEMFVNAEFSNLMDELLYNFANVK